jgi:hypothetical protein
MLALLDVQQELVSCNATPSVLNSIAAVEGQAAALTSARQSREHCQRQLAWALGRPEGEAFSELLPLLPPSAVRSWPRSSTKQANCCKQVRERAGLSHAQLRRSLHLMERFLTTLSAESLSARPAEHTHTRPMPTHRRSPRRLCNLHLHPPCSSSPGNLTKASSSMAASS